MSMAAQGRALPFTLRRATPEDAATISGIYHRTFTETFGHLYPPEELADWLAENGPEKYRADCASPDVAIMLGTGPAGQVLGFCLLGPQDLGIDSQRRWWVLRQFYLEADARGTGLAQALMQWAIGEARARGHEELYLTVWVDNHRARRFYERFGFEEVGRYAFTVGSTVDDDRIMKLSLQAGLAP